MSTAEGLSPEVWGGLEVGLDGPVWLAKESDGVVRLDGSD
jgi:hypothetical protein